MAERLKEWASGRAAWVTIKVYNLLTKYTGVKFSVCPTFSAYRNKWGLFIGKFAFGSNGRFYRLNFMKGKTEQIVSMDVWNKGLNPEKVMPSYICSLEGFGIGKVVTMLKDFIVAPDKALTESIEEVLGVLNEDVVYGRMLYENSVLSESADELRTFIKAFLSQSPTWQGLWASGNVDTTKYFNDAKVWIKSNSVNGRRYSGSPVLTTASLSSNTKTLIKREPSVLGNLSGASRNAQSVPSVAVVKGSSAGVNQKVDLTDAFEEKVTFDQIQQGMTGIKEGPLAQMARMKRSIFKIVAMGEYGETMVVIWGRGGIGKTRTLRDTLEEMGMCEGEGGNYLFIPASMNNCSDGSLMKWIINNRHKDLLIINDNDKIFERPSMLNVWKQVLEHDPKWGRKLQVAYPPGHKKGAEEPEEGTYEIECKFIWLSNINPDTAFDDTSGAMKSRYLSVRYDFTDEEVLSIVADKLHDIFPEFESVTDQDKAQVFNLFWKAVLTRLSQGIEKTDMVSFRAYNDAIQSLWFYKETAPSNWWKMFFDEYLAGKLEAIRKGMLTY